MARYGKRLTVVLALVALVAALAACSDDGTDVRDGDSATASGSGSATASGSGSATGTAEPECEPVGDPSEADSDVNVELGEFYVDMERSRLDAGTVTFRGDNVGGEAHEMLIVEGDRAADLPTDADGAVDEDALDDVLVGEVEPFPGGSECDGTFDLDPGHYILLCNIVEEQPDGTVESHFAEGMYATFAVTG